MLRASGIATELPRELGGGGFPPVRPDRVMLDAPRLHRQALFSALVHRDFGSMQKLVNLWRCAGIAGDVLEEALEQARLEVEAVPLHELPDSVNRLNYRSVVFRGLEVMTEDDALLRLAAVWAPALGIAGFFEGRSYCQPFGKFLKAHRASLGRMANRITGRGQPLSTRSELSVIEELMTISRTSPADEK
jgi:hypothetical protein